MMLDLDFRLVLCSREEFSFKNVYVSVLVGSKQLYTHQEIPIRNAIFRRKRKIKKRKRQNFKFCKSISHTIFDFVFNFQFFVFSYFGVIIVLVPPYDQKCPLCPLVLKTDYTLVQMLRLIHS